ncbi:UDP-glycosyltransferase [Caenimonas sedimenti]|uniref:UDP-glycosyltransferase n=1 Tax=Caenimonas sedimenti TaxID=2596921 RepID=A0A562ZKP0_9BURK|nr:UDP-glycosyltransferase [Caenimonas sedimenti]TWO68957.1 UDP-glycosyltransferase [Caenimonas sedimenti]
MNRPARLLAVSYGGGHIAMVLPVLRALRERMPDLQIHLLALTTARAAAAEFAPLSFGFAELLARWPDADATRHGQRLLASHTHPAVDPAESLAYLGLNWVDLERQHGAEEATQRYAQAGRGAFFPLHTLRRLLADLQPDFVLATNSPRAEQAALQAAVEAGIPNLALFDLFPIENDPYAQRPVLADCTAVVAPAAKAALVRAGVPEQAVVVTGNPAFDGLADPAHAAAALALRARLGWTAKWVVLYAGHAEPAAGPHWPAGTAFPLAIEDTLRDWVAADPDLALVIRQHPNHWHQFQEAWAGRPAHPRVHLSLPDEEPVEHALLAADAVVVQVSTVGVQAEVAGKPVFSMEESPAAHHAGFSWAGLGIATGIHALADLPPALEAARLRRTAPVLVIPTPAAASVAELVLRRLQPAAGS